MKVSIWYFVGFVVLVMVVSKIIDDHEERVFKSKIDKLESERSRLRKERAVYFDIIDSLSNEIDTFIIRIDSLNAKVDSIKQIRNEIPSIVDSMPVVKVDSILTGYVHPR